MRLPRFLFLASSLMASFAAPVPARAAGAPEPAPEAVLGTLPFQSWPEVNRVVVDLAPPGGDRLVMMVDTGANVSVITPRMARQMNISVRREKESPYRRKTLLGRDLQFWVDTRDSDTGSQSGYEYGLIGGDFLDDYVVEIDFPGRTVRFFDPRKYEVPKQVDAPDEEVIAFKLAGTRLAVPVELDGHALDVLLDTGAPDAMILSGDAARKVGIDVAALPSFGEGGSVLGPVELRFHEATGLRFGGATFAPCPVLVAPRGWYNQGLGNDSVIGYDTLAPFVARIDYPRRRLWLKRSAEVKPRLFGDDYVAAKDVGVYLVPAEGKVFVYKVLPDSAAARFGLREGDTIAAGEDGKLPSSEAIHAKIRAREALTVSRQENGGVVQRALPESPPTGAGQ